MAIIYHSAREHLGLRPLNSARHRVMTTALQPVGTLARWVQLRLFGLGEVLAAWFRLPVLIGSSMAMDGGPLRRSGAAACMQILRPACWALLPILPPAV